MPDWSLVSSSHVLAAIAECDRVGSREFVGRFGVRSAHAYRLWHRGTEYDAVAILGVAYLRATGRPASWDDVAGGQEGAAKILTDLGFDVVAEEQPVVPSRARKAAPAKARTAKARTAKPETVPTICPRCHIALPATGVCDFCD